MKVALIFLATVVVITHQQFQHPRRMLWMPYSAQRVLSNYYQPHFYDDVVEDESPLYRQLSPSRPFAYPQEEELNLVAADSQDGEEEGDYEDVQSRVKSFGRRRPSFMQQQNPRFFLNLIGGNSLMNPLLRTLTITLTSTINITSVQSCISSALFANAAAQNLACRRKRETDDSEDVQFAISPTETQELLPTALPSLDLMREKRQVDENVYREISSSLDEVPISETSNPDASFREKRFFLNGITLKTVVSYSFVSTTITKAVNIAAAPAAGTGGAVAAGPLLCKPAGYVVCA